MKTLLFATLLLTSQLASACFLSGEQTSGMNKICFYDCVSGTKAITVSAVSLCPLSLSQAPIKGADYASLKPRPKQCTPEVTCKF